MDLSDARKKELSSTLKSRVKHSWQYWAGIILILASVGFLGWNFFPIVYQEAQYALLSKNNNVLVVSQKEAAALSWATAPASKVIEPVDENFGIVIPKIMANAKVIADVDPNDANVYQKALTKGVVQARGSVTPGAIGNVFIFAHSGADFYEAERYNAVFYLLGKLEKGDDVYLFYQGQKFFYKVSNTKVVASDDTSIYDSPSGKKMLTLMTCWPAGTSLERLVVIAEEKSAPGN